MEPRSLSSGSALDTRVEFNNPKIVGDYFILDSSDEYRFPFLKRVPPNRAVMSSVYCDGSIDVLLGEGGEKLFEDSLRETHLVLERMK